jgi:hypothetical protein
MLIGQAFWQSQYFYLIPARTDDEIFLAVTDRYQESPTSGF